MRVSVSITEYHGNKQTTWHFSKLKGAYEFLKSMRKMYKNAYFALYFEVCE